jgi:ABC-2 type transport system ATP-binding protein
MMPLPDLITAESVSATYGRVRALNGLTFSAGRGICALLGPNGAGKTTLLSAVMGLKRFDGSIVVGDEPIRAGGGWRRKRGYHVGYLPQRFDLAGGFRVHETVAYAAWCNGVPRPQCHVLADEATAKMGLAEKRNHKVRTLSGGERQRLGIACAIAHRPSILLLDEPTVGLDPTQRSRLRKYLTVIAESTCIILATHLLEDVQIVADKVIVVYRGAVAFAGSKEEMARLGESGRQDYESALESAYRILIDSSGAG